MTSVDTTCRFVQDYAPSKNGPETPVLTHIANCLDCQEQSHVIA